MKVDILSREYPPKVYGGAGVHAEELSKVLAERVEARSQSSAMTFRRNWKAPMAR